MTRPWRSDLTGQRFDRLVVLREADAGTHRRWECRCDCGTTVVVFHPALRSGNTRSCGCLRREITTSRMTVHGEAKRSGWTRTYRIWLGMVSRCTIQSATGYARYGGAGIAVCSRWRSFEKFRADMGEAPDKMSIDRWPDNAGDYRPGNCRWATAKQQAQNSRPRGFDR